MRWQSKGKDREGGGVGFLDFFQFEFLKKEKKKWNLLLCFIIITRNVSQHQVKSGLFFHEKTPFPLS